MECHATVNSEESVCFCIQHACLTSTAFFNHINWKIVKMLVSTGKGVRLCCISGCGTEEVKFIGLIVPDKSKRIDQFENDMDPKHVFSCKRTRLLKIDV